MANGDVFTAVGDAVDADTTKITVRENGSDKQYDCKASRTYYAPAGEAAAETAVNYFDKDRGLLRLSIDKTSKRQYNSEYNYDKKGRLKSKVEEGIGTLEQDLDYDAKGNVTCLRYEINGAVQNYCYEYEEGEKGGLKKTVLPCGTEQTVVWDGLDRTAEIRTGKLSKNIYYAKYGDHATGYVSTVRYGCGSAGCGSSRYTYDKNGNISSIWEDGREAASYEYDALNRLVQEDNKLLNEVQSYEYDNNGNILSKTVNGVRTEYAYTLEGWRDRLVSAGGESIGEYDLLGNPWQYKGAALKWSHGRNLDGYGEISYTYNAAGLRTSKTIGGKETSYYLDGSRIIAEERRDNGSLTDAIEYYYGAEGITGFKHNGKVYLYEKNVQGDVRGIYELAESGELTLKVRYIYDAWGNTSITPDSDRAIAILNPFRYRSYYCDGQEGDSGLYYLESRYYDPKTGRFINADDIENALIQLDQPNGLNLFAFCLNNPVKNSDPTGAFIVSSFITGLIIAAAVGGIVGFGGSVISQGLSKGWHNINWWQAGVAGLFGVAGGALAVTGLGAFAITGIGAGLGFLGGVSDALFEQKDFAAWQTWLGIGISAGIGAFAGFIGGRGAGHVRNLSPAYYSNDLIKANRRHALNLLKSATAQFKSGAGAASALRASGNALHIAITASNAAVNKVFKQKLFWSLFLNGLGILGGSIGSGLLNYFGVF